MYKKGLIFGFIILTGLIYESNGQNIRNFQDFSPRLTVEENLEIADNFYNQDDFHLAKTFYQYALDLDSLHQNAEYKLGKSFQHLRAYDSAAISFQKIDESQKNSFPLLYFDLGKVLKAQGLYDQALASFDNFISAYASKYKDEAAIANWEINAIEGSNAIRQNQGETDIKLINPSPNTSENAFGAMKMGEQKVIYTGVVALKNKSKKDLKHLTAVFGETYVNRIFSFSFSNEGPYNKHEEAIKLSKDHWSVGSPYITKDKKQLFFTLKDEEKQQLSIYTSEYKAEHKWSDAHPLNNVINAPGTNNKNATIGYDDKGNQYMFFASNRPGGFGGYDIWYAKINENGAYEKAINLGPGVNTKHDEVTPYFSNDTKLLFFSSDGHEGLGMLDVYIATIDFLNKKGIIYNAGKPINSAVDDYYFSINPDGKTGYITSNRKGNHQKNQSMMVDNIYHMTFNAPFTFKNLPDYLTQVSEFAEDDMAFKLFDEAYDYQALLLADENADKMAENDITIDGNVFLKEGQDEPVIYLVQNGNEVVDSVKTDEDGKFSFFALPSDGKYSVKINSDDELEANMSFFNDKGEVIKSVNSKDDTAYFRYNNLAADAAVLAALDEDDISIDGSVFDGNVGASGQLVYLLDKDNNIVDSTYTDENGHFHFKALDADDKYTVSMQSDEDLSANMAFFMGGKEINKVDSKKDEAFFDFRKLDDKSAQLDQMTADNIVITGSLLSDGKPAPNSKVVLVDENDNIVASQVTDSEGNFAFRGLPGSNKYVLQMDDSGNLTANMNFFDSNENLLLSTGSETNDTHFQYRNLRDENIGGEDLANQDVALNMDLEDNKTDSPVIAEVSAPIAEVAQTTPQDITSQGPSAIKLKSMFRWAMTYDQYNDLVQQHGAELEKDINLRVQIGAFKKPKADLFSNVELGQIDKELTKGLTKFLIGNFNKLENAEVLRKKAFDQGISDAFVSVYYKGERVALLIYNDKNQLIRKYEEN